MTSIKYMEIFYYNLLVGIKPGPSHTGVVCFNHLTKALLLLCGTFRLVNEVTLRTGLSFVIQSVIDNFYVWPSNFFSLFKVRRYVIVCFLFACILRPTIIILAIYLRSDDMSLGVSIIK